MDAISLRRTAAVLAGLLLAALAPSGGMLHAQQAAPSDSAAVVETIERYHAALAAGDTATAMRLLSPEVVILESGGIEDREEYRAHHLAADMAFARAAPRTRGPLQVSVHGDVAWAASTSVTQGTFRDRQVDSQGAELMVLVREGDRWRISAIHWSSRNRRGS